MSAPARIPSVTEELERVLSSSTFRSAGRSAKLLRFLVEETLAGRSDRLKDYTLGAEALGRGDSFDPRTDPIARVEASRLRSRLEHYYATEGRGDALLICLPKGGYVPSFEERSPAEDVTSKTGLWPLVAVGVAVLTSLVFAALWFWNRTPQVTPLQEIRTFVETPPTTDPLSFALAPDGQSIAFVATSNGTATLWLRPMNSTTAMRPLAGTDRASFPFWSPDSRCIGFFSDGQLRRVDLESGLVTTVTRAVVPAGGAWSKDGTILFPTVPDAPLMKVSEKGGEATVFTLRQPEQRGHRSPQFLPDQRHFLYYATSNRADTRGIYVGDLQDPHFSKRVSTESDSPAGYARGHLFFLRQRTLFSQPFDIDSLEVGGEARPVAESIAFGSTAETGALSTSEAGLVAYRTGSAGKRQFVWFDRAGNVLERVGDAVDFGRIFMAISPDGSKLATQGTSQANTDIYVMDTKAGTAPVRLTSDPKSDISPIWSADGRSIVYASPTPDQTAFDLYRIALDGSLPPVLIWKSPESKQALDWVQETLLVRSVNPETSWDLWAVAVDGKSTPRPVVATKAIESDGRFSPDRKWVAYQSNESGLVEIYLQPFPGPGPRVRVSLNGGAKASWNGTGTELFYLALDGTLMSRSVTLPANSQDAVKLGDPRPLFSTKVNAVEDLSRSYGVSKDGKRFLVDTMVEETAAPITLILNWQPSNSRVTGQEGRIERN